MPDYLPPIAGRYKYNAGTARYQDTKTGRMVPERTIRTAVDATLRTGANSQARATSAMIDGKITLGEWQDQMAVLLRMQHTASAAAAAGGWSSLTDADWKIAKRILEGQMRYLTRFARVIGRDELSDAEIKYRAGLYSEAPRVTYEAVRRGLQRRRGAEEEQRVLGVAEHCECCIVEAEKGRQPAGELKAIGECSCIVKCKCTMRYFDSEGEEI